MTEWKQKLQHIHHYNRTANLYNLRYTEEQNLKIKAAVENLELEKQRSILDMGCGTGLLLPRIRKMAENVVGLDISKGMLGEVKSSIKRSANVHFVLADADNTPFRNNYFDMAFAITLLQNMPNPHHTLQEAKRITKPNASIIVTALKKRFTEHSFLKLLEEADLEPKLLKTGPKLKCHIATCKRRN